MENEIRTNELEEKKDEEALEEVSPEAEEAVEEKLEETQPISYTSSFLETIEEARGVFLKTYRFQNTLRWIVSLFSIAAVVFGCVGIPNMIGGTGGTVAMVSILVGALAITILFSVFSKKYLRKKMREYFDLYYQNVNQHVFGELVADLKPQFPGKIPQEAFIDNNLYKDVVDVGSRGLTEFVYNNIPVAVVDAAAQSRKDKRLVPLYVGKYLYAASNYSFDEPTYIYFKGDKRALPPNHLEDVKVVHDDKKMTIYCNSDAWKKVINKEVKSILQSIEMNKELVDLSISLQKGRVFVCMGYDDPLMVLPLQNQFDPKPTEIFKKDVVKVLKLIEEFNK